jgi:hypothetical protein
MMLDRVASILKDGGLTALGWRAFSYGYKGFVRPLLPRADEILYSGVAIGNRRLGDKTITRHLYRAQIDDIPDYEGAIVKGLHLQVKPGDLVVVVGGGLGIACVVAAKLSKTGRVICFEGDSPHVELTRNTARLNGVSDRVDVVHAIVAADIRVYGGDHSGNVIPASELPKCDVLNLDCEGAEIQILREMKITPRALVVETHGPFGSPTAQVRAILEARGYKVEDLGAAEPRFEEEFLKGDVKVLVGILAS